MSMFDVFNIAGSALHAQSARLNATASNLANADSVAGPDGQPYRAKQVVFTAAPVTGPNSVGVQVSRVVEMSNVNVVEEMTNMISASRAYQTNAEVMNTAKSLIQRTLAIGQ